MLTSNLDLSKTISTVAHIFSSNIKLVDLVMPLIVKSPVTSYLSMSIFSAELSLTKIWDIPPLKKIFRAQMIF